MTQRVLDWPREIKQLTVLALDVVLALVSTWLAFGLRFDVWGRPVDAQWRSRSEQWKHHHSRFQT